MQQELQEIRGAITKDTTFMTVLKAFLEWKAIHKYGTSTEC